MTLMNLCIFGTQNNYKREKKLINKVGFIWFGWKNRVKKSKESKLIYIYIYRQSLATKLVVVLRYKLSQYLFIKGEF